MVQVIVPGVRLATFAAGIKHTKRDDLLLVECQAGTSIAGVFTQNAARAAPIEIAVAHLKQLDAQKPVFLLVNAGNANAATGKHGIENALATCQTLAQQVRVPQTNILPFSTGVIGEPLPVELIVASIPKLVKSLNATSWHQAAKSIMTTDTQAKIVHKSIVLDGETLTITGIAKGAGMIQPNMATMLAYIATNAKIDPQTCQQLLEGAVEQSFNRISIDGDTSTNDACMLIASNESTLVIEPKSPHETAFAQLLNQVALELALLIVKDGEGATKCVTVAVEEARNNTEAKAVAFGVANSPLVKTALFAADPNWGRIVMALGNHLALGTNLNKLAIYINDYQVVEDGVRVANYAEDVAQQAMQPTDICLRIALRLGKADYHCYTCDLSHQYVTINADYRS